jgi:hypothetical protein
VEVFKQYLDLHGFTDLQWAPDDRDHFVLGSQVRTQSFLDSQGIDEFEMSQVRTP